MNYPRFISLFAFAGLVIPAAFQTVWWLINRYQGVSLNFELYVQNLMLILWPSSIMTLPAGSDEHLLPVLLLISTVVNVVFYVVIGTAVWFGIKKNPAILVLTIVVLVVIYWRVLTL